MNIAIDISLSPQELSEIERQLRYLDFVAQRPLPTPATDSENIEATFIALAALTGREYNDSILLAILGDTSYNHPNTRFVRNAYGVIAGELQGCCDIGIIDESRIVAMAASLGELPSKQVKVSAALSNLVEWWLLQSQSDGAPLAHGCKVSHPLLAVGVFLYEFMEQNTLDDFREEVMLLLSLMLLRRCGCNWLAIYTPLRVMVQDRVAYNRALKSRISSQSPISSWLVYWVDCLYRAAVSACRTFAPALPELSPSRISPINLRQRRILEFIGTNQPVRLADISKHLSKESVNTLKKDLLRLRALGFVITDGAAQSMRYYRA